MFNLYNGWNIHEALFSDNYWNLKSNYFFIILIRKVLGNTTGLLNHIVYCIVDKYIYDNKLGQVHLYGWQQNT